MKKQNKDFEQFQREFKKRQQQFGLLGCKCYFKHEPMEESFAEITIDRDNATATVRLNSKLETKDKPFANPVAHAKHEALHLLTGRLNNLARSRFASSDEIYEAWEELVRKLEVLIP